jgi:hypothetical protein
MTTYPIRNTQIIKGFTLLAIKKLAKRMVVINMVTMMARP